MRCTRTITHVIQQGDTIYRLAKSYDTTVPEILMNNLGINPYNLQVGTSLVICQGENADGQQENEMMLNQNLRSLWEQLVYWMRMYLLAQAGDGRGTEAIERRINRIIDEMEDLFARYYPAELAAELKDELNRLTTGMLRLIGLVKAGDPKETDELDAELEQDVQQLAGILSNMNINYNREDLERELGEYLMLTKREIVARLSEEYADDIDTFDELERQALKLADYLSVGIIRQQ